MCTAVVFPDNLIGPQKYYNHKLHVTKSQSFILYDDNNKSLCSVDYMDSHCGTGQIGVLVFQFAVQCKTPLIPIVGQQWCQIENFAKPNLIGLNRKSFPAKAKSEITDLIELIMLLQKELSFFEIIQI